MSWAQKFTHDIHYVDHQSWQIDIKIFCLTLYVLVVGNGINMSQSVTMPEFNGSN